MEQTKAEIRLTIDNNGTISPKRIVQKIDLLNSHTYIFDYFSKEDCMGLKDLGETKSVLSLPNPCINSIQKVKWFDQILKSHRDSERPTTGVMLTGVKGSGKTIDANQLALKSGLPVIILGENAELGQLHYFFQEMTEKLNICLLIDETEKNKNKLAGMYRIMEGSDTTFRKIIIFTTNETKDLDSNLKNRPGRIRYWRKYDEVPAKFKKSVAKTLGMKDENGEIDRFINERFDVETLDIVKAFLEEVKSCELDKPDVTERELYAVASTMNIELRGQNKFQDARIHGKPAADHLEHLSMILKSAKGTLSESGMTKLQEALNTVKDGFNDYGIGRDILDEMNNEYFNMEDEEEFDDDYGED